MTYGEKLAKLQKQVEAAQRRKKPMFRLRKVAIFTVLIAGTLVGLWRGGKKTESEQAAAYDLYCSSPGMQVPFEFIDYQDLFYIWNKRDLGNDVNTILTGGSTYLRNGQIIVPSTDGQSVDITSENGTHWTLPVSSSYLNVRGSRLYYRNDIDRCVYAFDLESGDNTLILDGNVGEVFLTYDLLYYIDHRADGAVKMMDLEGHGLETVVDGPVDSFVVCGNAIVYLDTNQSLFCKKLDTDYAELLVANVERFLFGERIYAESKNTVFSLNSAGEKAKEEYVSDSDTLRLSGYLNGRLFIQEEGALKTVEKQTAQPVYSGDCLLYASLSQDEEGKIYAVTESTEKHRHLVVIEERQEGAEIKDEGSAKTN